MQPVSVSDVYEVPICMDQSLRKAGMVSGTKHMKQRSCTMQRTKSVRARGYRQQGAAEGLHNPPVARA